MLKATILTASALTLGLGLGYLAADGQPDVQVKEVPVVHTIAKRVEVPGPVRWKTRTETQVQVRKVKVYTVPSACLAALNSADDIQAQAGVFARTAAQYPPLVAKAYKAGVLQDGQQAKDIAARMQGLTGKIEGLSISEVHEVYTIAASACRSF